jgi:hypothetical protein
MSIVLNGTGGTISGVPGQVLQVVNATTSTSTGTTTVGTLTATTLSATITPSSTSSKILILMTNSVYIGRGSSTDVGIGVGIFRNGSQIYADGGYYYNLYYSSSNIGNIRNRTPLQYLDSPASTSALTYTLYIGLYATPANSAQASLNVDGETSWITLMEIAA